MRKLFLFSLVTLLLACQVPIAQAPEFTQEQLAKDLDVLVKALNSYHPGLYWYQNEEDFNREVANADAAIANGQDLLAFYATVNKLTASIGCGHTRTRIPRERMNLLIDTTLVLPLNVIIYRDKIFTATSSKGIEEGSEILSIDGVASIEIIKSLRLIIPSDGYNTTGKDHSIGQRFGLLMAMYLGINGPSSTIVFTPPNNANRLNAVIQHELIADNFPDTNEPLMSLTDARSAKTKILRIKTFGRGELEQENFDYYNFLEASFSQLKKEEIQNLIIDVRGNGGGNDDFGATLVSYITDQPFGYFDRIEVTESYTGSARIERADDNTRLMMSHQDLDEQEPKVNRFGGEVFILADGGSFSTTADFVSISKNIGAATIVGLETGGGACGNTSGHSTRITLENTGISIGVPMWHYFSDIDTDLECGHGVYPDYEILDLPYTNQDEALEKVLTLLKN